MPGHPPSPKNLSHSLNTGRLSSVFQQADQAGRHLDLHGWAHRPPLDLSDRRRRPTTSFGRPWACLVAPWMATPRFCRSHDPPPTGVRVAFLAPQPPSPPPLPSWTRRRGMASSSAIWPWHHTASPGHEHRPPAPATLTSPSHCRHLWRRRPRAWLAVAAPSTRTATTRLPAPARADARHSSSVPGCGLRAKP